jgi:hypothetical protein
MDEVNRRVLLTRAGTVGAAVGFVRFVVALRTPIDRVDEDAVAALVGLARLAENAVDVCVLAGPAAVDRRMHDLDVRVARQNVPSPDLC